MAKKPKTGYLAPCMKDLPASSLNRYLSTAKHLEHSPGAGLDIFRINKGGILDNLCFV
jgi:hypothetical protein